MKIDGVVVFYNPTIEMIDNIKKYYPILNHLFVIDNSNKINEEVVSKVKELEKATYISLGENKGIGYALKVGLEKVKEDNADICLTMDQDSIFPIDKWNEIKEYLEKEMSNYAIIGLNFNKNETTKGLVEVKTLLTSGNFINMSDYKKIKGFNEDLFIDCVDFELCEQFYNINRKIAYINEASLIHQMGDNPIRKRFFGIPITCLNHSPIRYYYRYRNGYYLYHKNKKFYKNLKNQFFSIKLKVVLYEPNKKEKLKMMSRGIRDAKRNILGPYKGE